MDTLEGLVRQDVKAALDVVLVMGTSLAIPGIQVLLQTVKSASKHPPLFIIVNNTRPPKKLDNIFHYHVQGDVDDWAAGVSAAFVLGPAGGTAGAMGEAAQVPESSNAAQIPAPAIVATLPVISGQNGRLSTVRDQTQEPLATSNTENSKEPEAMCLDFP